MIGYFIGRKHLFFLIYHRLLKNFPCFNPIRDEIREKVDILLVKYSYKFTSIHFVHHKIKISGKYAPYKVRNLQIGSESTYVIKHVNHK